MSEKWSHEIAVEIVEKYKVMIYKEGDEIDEQDYLVGLIAEALEDV